MIKHLIFDFDGVIADSLHSTMKNINILRLRGFGKLPLVNSQDDMAKLYDIKLSDCLLKYGYSKEDTKSFFDQHTTLMNNDVENIKIFDEISSVFYNTKLPCSIISSSYVCYMKSILLRSDLRLTRFFSIEGRESLRKKSDKILNLCKKNNYSTDEVVYIGDTASDILICKDIGIPIIAVGFGFHPSEYLQRFSPHYIVSDIKELNKLLAAICC